MKTYEVFLTTSTSVTVRIQAENEEEMAEKISDLDVMSALQEQIAKGQTYLDWVIDDIDLVLIMSVNPGFGGQKFIPHSLERIRTVRRWLDETGSAAELQVDGGVSATNARAVVAGAGALWFLYLGGRLLLRPRDALPDGSSLEGSPGRLFWRGVWVNFSNPKTVPWILVIIQAGRLPTDGFHLSSLLALFAVTVVSETSVMSLYAFLADRLRRHLRTPAIVRWPRASRTGRTPTV